MPYITDAEFTRFMVLEEKDRLRREKNRTRQNAYRTAHKSVTVTPKSVTVTGKNNSNINSPVTATSQLHTPPSSPPLSPPSFFPPKTPFLTTPSYSPTSSPPSQIRGNRLPPEWTPSTESITAVKNLGFSDSEITSTTEEFRDYWIAIPGQRGIKINWDATWRNWFRKKKNINHSGKKLMGMGETLLG